MPARLGHGERVRLPHTVARCVGKSLPAEGGASVGRGVQRPHLHKVVVLLRVGLYLHVHRGIVVLRGERHLHQSVAIVDAQAARRLHPRPPVVLGLRPLLGCRIRSLAGAIIRAALVVAIAYVSHLLPGRGRVG